MNYAVEKWTRRAALTAIGAVAALGLGTGTANADMLADLAKQAAASEHPVVWYESSQEDQIEKVIAAFNKRYPDVKVEHLRVLGGNKMTGRVIQEIQGQGYSGDLVTTGADQAWEMNGRGLLQEANWGELGVPAKLTPEPFTVAMAASVYVLLVNTDKVKPEDEPKGWQGVNDMKWKGRMGSWVRAGAHTQMAKVWGVEKAQAELEAYMKLEPLLFKSTFPLAQQVGAGEVDIAIGFFHSTQPAIDAGAPVKRIALDPAPMHTIYTSMTKGARNVAGAKLFLSWLTTSEGAAAYESATSRGSHLLPGTKTYELVKDAEAAEWPAEETATYQETFKVFNKILGSAGAAR